jgi:hypothetical protein
LILFLYGYFVINIYLYSYDSKLLKIYYLEDKLYTEKDSVIITMKKDKLKIPNTPIELAEDSIYYNVLYDMINNKYS